MSIIEEIGLKPRFDAEYHVMGICFVATAGTTTTPGKETVPENRYFIVTELSTYSAPYTTTAKYYFDDMFRFKIDVCDLDISKIIPPRVIREYYEVQVYNGTAWNTTFISNLKGYTIPKHRWEDLIKYAREVIHR